MIRRISIAHVNAAVCPYRHSSLLASRCSPPFLLPPMCGTPHLPRSSCSDPSPYAVPCHPSCGRYAYPGDFVLSGLRFKFYDHPPPSFSISAADTSLAAHAHTVARRSLQHQLRPDGRAKQKLPWLRRRLQTQKVDAGGPRSGGTLLTIELTGHQGLAPFLALETDVTYAIQQSRCAFGQAPHLIHAPKVSP